jgi:NTE family protein
MWIFRLKDQDSIIKMKPKIGLALSGGGARGFAHIGILKGLEAAGIDIDFIAGASMGGVIGACYAAGLTARQLEDRILDLSRMRELMKLIDLAPHRRGLLEGNKVRAYLADLLDEDCTFESLRIPLSVTAVDLLQGKEVVLNHGPLLPAIMSTIAIPGLFAPTILGPYRLVDGGVLNNLPFDHVRAMGADIVIAVDVQLDPQYELPWQDLPEKPHWPIRLPDFFLDFYRAELIMISAINQMRLQNCPPDMLIRPPIPPDITMFLGFPYAKEIITAGEQAIESALPRILEIIELHAHYAEPGAVEGLFPGK